MWDRFMSKLHDDDLGTTADRPSAPEEPSVGATREAAYEPRTGR